LINWKLGRLMFLLVNKIKKIMQKVILIMINLSSTIIQMVLLLMQSTTVCPDEYKFFKLKDDEPKKMKPEDKVTIEISLGELARAYAVMGRVNGSGGAIKHTIFGIAQEIFKNKDREIRDRFSYTFDKIFTPCIDYYAIKEDWEELLFGPQETEQQKKVRELREKAQSLLDEADALERNNK